MAGAAAARDQVTEEVIGASSGLLFTAQPKAPASVLAGVFGWVVND
jgi:hypothetical protein